MPNHCDAVLGSGNVGCGVVCVDGPHPRMERHVALVAPRPCGPSKRRSSLARSVVFVLDSLVACVGGIRPMEIPLGIVAGPFDADGHDGSGHMGCFWFYRGQKGKS